MVYDIFMEVPHAWTYACKMIWYGDISIELLVYAEVPNMNICIIYTILKWPYEA